MILELKLILILNMLQCKFGEHKAKLINIECIQD